jgi:hypothetical protein
VGVGVGGGGVGLLVDGGVGTGLVVVPPPGLWVPGFWVSFGVDPGRGLAPDFAPLRGQRAGAVRDRVGALAVVLVPGQNGVQVVLRVVVAKYGRVHVGLDRKVAVPAAEVVGGGQGGVVDVVGVLHAVAVAVAARPRPGGGDELHRADGSVIRGVAVVDTVVGVLDCGEAVAVEDRAEDLRVRRAVRVDPTARCLAGLHLADGGEELPGQVAARLGPPEFGLRLLVGVEDGRGDA